MAARDDVAPAVDLAVDLARSAVAATEPAEMPLFEVTASAYKADPAGADRGMRLDDDILGFGVGLAAATPYLLAIAGVVVDAVLGELTAAALNRSRDAALTLLRRWLGGVDEEPPLTPQQLARVRAAALDKASALGLPSERGAVLADAVVGSLAMADPQP